VAMTAAAIAEQFFDRLEKRDLDGVLSLIDPEASIELLPLRVKGTGKKEGHEFFQALFDSFPDLRVAVRSLLAGDETVVAEIKLSGTQAADFYGIINQEKHIDVDQGWLLTVQGGQITGLRAYWCQNQVYRRLGVKRIDQVTITA
jgi:ketosteroid isomerase-like protein